MVAPCRPYRTNAGRSRPPYDTRFLDRLRGSPTCDTKRVPRCCRPSSALRLVPSPGPPGGVASRPPGMCPGRTVGIRRNLQVIKSHGLHAPSGGKRFEQPIAGAGHRAPRRLRQIQRHDLKRCQRASFPPAAWRRVSCVSSITDVRRICICARSTGGEVGQLLRGARSRDRFPDTRFPKCPVGKRVRGEHARQFAAAVAPDKTDRAVGFRQRTKPVPCGSQILLTAQYQLASHVGLLMARAGPRAGWSRRTGGFNPAPFSTGPNPACTNPTGWSPSSARIRPALSK